MNNQIIERVQSTKYLGITIDELTTFKEHANNIANTLKKYCGIFYKFRTRLPSSYLKTIYFAMIHSHINYGIAIYANTTDNHLDPLIKMNNKILTRVGHILKKSHKGHLGVFFDPQKEIVITSEVLRIFQPNFTGISHIWSGI